MRLFPNTIDGPRHPEYDVSPDDQRFLMIRDLDDGEEAAELVVVENLFEGLKATVGN